MTPRSGRAPRGKTTEPRPPADTGDIRGILDEPRGDGGGLVSMLEDIQAKYGYLPEESLRALSRETGRSLVDVYGVATFYRAFTLQPRGKHVVTVCLGTACHVRGGPRIVEELERQLNIKAGETASDGEFTLETVNCLGACALGPIVVADGHYFTNVKPSMVSGILNKVRAGTLKIGGDTINRPTVERDEGTAKLRAIADLTALRDRLRASRDPAIPTLVVPCGTCGLASGAYDLVQAAEKHIRQQNQSHNIRLKTTGCHGFCQMEPSILVEPAGIFYPRVHADSVPRIVDATVCGKQAEDLVYVDPMTGRRIAFQNDIPFFSGQRRAILARNEEVDPSSINDYIEHGGYSSLAGALAGGDPSAVILEISASGLRGRGGAGFPTGRKWELLARAPGGRRKVLVCNADEGDPGAYMDRSVLEGNPHSIIEGMLIGAFATGATEGVVYVRTEYPLAIRHLGHALEAARGLGLLGTSILGSALSFEITMVKGAGAFVCGEETALMHSIEGRMGEPRQRPPFPIEEGIGGRPTLINNVETWANIPLIVRDGAKAFAAVGTANNSGTKIFSLVGKIRNTGLVEVPMGITIGRIVNDIGGGPAGKAKIKAVQTGGPSGGCIPAGKFDLPIDYDTLAKAGSIMGSGGMIVMDENTCMVDVARYFMNFLKDESCGKCFTCRKGTQRMHEILDDISRGKARPEDMDLLQELAETVKDTTLCGLGQTASNPVLSTLRYFRDEYLAHIRDKRCPAGVCRALVTYRVSAACKGCGACVKACAQKAIGGKRKERHVIDAGRCVKCGACANACQFGAIEAA